MAKNAINRPTKVEFVKNWNISVLTVIPSKSQEASNIGGSEKGGGINYKAFSFCK
jgi:hypothetical protein